MAYKQAHKKLRKLLEESEEEQPDIEDNKNGRQGLLACMSRTASSSDSNLTNN
jgi:hypothetical protein